jgi:hypothetical protein
MSAQTTLDRAHERPSWGAVAAAIEQGIALRDACARGRLGAGAVARLAPRWAGSWVELIDELEGCRVLLVEHSPGRAGFTLSTRCDVVGVVEPREERRRFRRAWFDGCRAQVLLDDEASLLGNGPWDVVILDGTLDPATPRELGSRVAQFARCLSPEGRLVIVSDNLLSALRAFDRMIGRPVGRAGPPLPRIQRVLTDAGLSVTQRFGLLRSSLDAVTNFDIDARRAAAAVLEAAGVRAGGSRGHALTALHHLADHRGLAELVPAWMLIASANSARWASRRRPTGRLGYADSGESKLVRGEPPVELEKTYSSSAQAMREAVALAVLEAAGIPWAPRLLGVVSGNRSCQTWVPGRPLRPSSLTPDGLRKWVTAGAGTLGSMQGATRRRDGTVLVHGDFWLGNLLVRGDGVATVVDWSAAHWGDPDEDLLHLVNSLVTAGLVPSRQAHGLLQSARLAYAAGLGAEGRLGR